MSPRQIWIAAALAFALLNAAGVGLSIWRDYDVTVANLKQDTASQARLMAAHAEQGLLNAARGLDRAAFIIASGFADDPAARDAVRVRLDDLVVGNSAIGTIWAVDREGRTLINNNNPRPAPIDNAKRPYFAAHLNSEARLHVGATEMGTVVRRPRFTLSRSILAADGSFTGVVVAGIDARYLNDIYSRVPGAGAVVRAAFNGDGAILAAEPALDDAAAGRVRAVLADPPGAAGAREIDGWIFAAERLREVPITLVAGTDLDAALSDWRIRSFRLGLVGLAVIAGFLALTIQGLRAVSREESARKDLLAANETLERRVGERTATVELLFRELNHRVKNNLQIVASLQRLQMRKSSDPELKATLQDSINRIFAIADVHSEIENARDGSIALKSYVGKIVQRICDAMSKPDQTIAVDLDIADVELPLDRAVLIAIAINETVTNAFKHAFAERPEGRLSIAVGVTDGRLQLAVGNDVAGALPSDRPAEGSSGLGSSILGMLVQQMNGSYRIERDGGYTVRIEVPIG